MPEFPISPSIESKLASPSSHSGPKADRIPSDLATLSIAIHLEEDVSAAKDEQVRVLCNDAVDDTSTFEEGKLGIGFVWCDDVGDGFGSECLRSRHTVNDGM